MLQHWSGSNAQGCRGCIDPPSTMSSIRRSRPSLLPRAVFCILDWFSSYQIGFRVRLTNSNRSALNFPSMMEVLSCFTFLMTLHSPKSFSDCLLNILPQILTISLEFSFQKTKRYQLATIQLHCISHTTCMESIPSSFNQKAILPWL